MPRPAFTDPFPPPWGFKVFAGVAAVSLLLNLLLGNWYWRKSSLQDARLAQLEARLQSMRPTEDAAAPADNKRATREDRVAFLLAVAGNANESKRVLTDVSAPECAEMFRALLACPAAGDRNGALDALCQHLTRSDPAGAVALLSEVPEATLRATRAVRATDLWTDQNPADAAQWLDRLGERFLPRETLDVQLARAVTRWAAYEIPPGPHAFSPPARPRARKPWLPWQTAPSNGAARTPPPPLPGCRTSLPPTRAASG